jgi:hypothetical protein
VTDRQFRAVPDSSTEEVVAAIKWLEGLDPDVERLEELRAIFDDVLRSAEEREAARQESLLLNECLQIALADFPRKRS